jgi:hypothetical protein
MRYLVPLFLVGLAACYSPRSIGPDAQAAGPYGGWDDEPMQASLWIDPHTFLASIDVNKPAHVALFHWRPGESFSLVYPRIGEAHQRSFDAGRHHLWTRSRSYFPTRGHSMAHRTSMQSGMGEPSYFVLIASERPLDVLPFMGTGRSMWVNRVAWSYNLYTATELLASQVVPQPTATDWTASYQVVWPIGDRQPRAPEFIWVDCAGVHIVVPLDVFLRGNFFCPDGEQVQPVPADSAVAPQTGVADRIVQLREGRGASAARPSDEEVRSLMERIREARRDAGEEVEAMPLPRLRGADQARARTSATASGSPFRPVIRPTMPARAEAAGRAQLPGLRSDPRSRQSVDRPRPHADSPRPQAERSRPAAQRPRPQAERPPPRVDRPQPQREPTPARPVRDRPPPDQSRD